MKNFVKIVFVAVFAIVAGYGIYTNQKTDSISDLALANVEALAQSESGKDVYCCGNYGDCMYTVSGGVVKGIKYYLPCP